jgi:cobalt/nickel transport system permease protein
VLPETLPASRRFEAATVVGLAALAAVSLAIA